MTNKNYGDFAKIPGTNYPMLDLFPLQPEHADMIAAWIGDDKANCWLDLGSGRQSLQTRDLYLLLTSPRTHARLFRLPGETEPLGLVCLNDVGNLMGSAEVWGVRGSYKSGPPNLSVAAFLLILANGFLDCNRSVIGSWIVAGNSLSISMHKRLGLQETGRQRARHVMNGVAHDRLLYDITRAEFAARFPAVPSETGRSISGTAVADDAQAAKESIYA